MRKEYLKKSLKIHPDKCKAPLTAQQCKEQFQELTADNEFYQDNC